MIRYYHVYKLNGLGDTVLISLVLVFFCFFLWQIMISMANAVEIQIEGGNLNLRRILGEQRGVWKIFHVG